MPKMVRATVTQTSITVLVGDLEENRMLHTSFMVAGKITNERKIEKLSREAAENMGLAFIKVVGVEYIKAVYSQTIEKFIENGECEVLL